MKHLKQYNEDFTLLHNDDLNQGLSQSSPIEYSRAKLVGITIQVKLEKLLKDNNYTSMYVSHRENMKPKSFVSSYKYIAITDIYNNMFVISETDDEWFYVRENRKHGPSNYYKCDQYDGLISCLKKFNLI